MNKDYWKAILMRAWHAVWETAAATLPATVVITPAMIEHFDKSVFVAIAAWLATALVAGAISIVKSLAVGVPEAQLAQTLYDLDNDPDEDDEEEFDGIDEIGIPVTEEGDE